MEVTHTNETFNTFIFDLDGTLLDTLPDLVVVTNGVLAEFGFPKRTPAEILSFVGSGVQALMVQAVPEGTPADVVERALARWKEKYAGYPNELTRPYPHIPETLAALKARGCKLAVLSNKFEGGVLQVIGQFLPGYFDVLHGESEGIPRKPDPTGLLRTINELGSTPEQTVFVGDSPSTDIATAKAAGVFSVGVTWGYHTRDVLEASHADLVIDDPSRLLFLYER